MSVLLGSSMNPGLAVPPVDPTPIAVTAATMGTELADAVAVPVPALPEGVAPGPRLHIDYAAQGDTLAQYIANRDQRCFIMGPLGSGKTNASCWKLFRHICEQAPDAKGVRRTRFLAVRNTYSDLFGTTIKDWLELFAELGKFTKGGSEPPTHRLKFRLEDGTRVDAEVIFLALDREEHTRKLRGYQLTGAWINETKELPFPIVSMLDGRMGRFPKDVWPTWYGIFGDTNAADTDHWYYRLAEELRPEGWVFLRQPGGVVRQSPQHAWEENRGQFAPAIAGPAENLSNLVPGYYRNGIQGKGESFIRINYANEYGYVGDGMPVWPDYVDAVHCRGFELVPGLPLHIGLDFGLTPAAIIGQQMPTGQWRWRFEVVTTDTGVSRFAGILKRFLAAHCKGYAIAGITGDPAGDQRQLGDNEERTVFQLLEAEGVVAEPASSNDFTVRSEAVAKALRTLIDGAPGFLLHPDCRVTRKGMQGAYKFRRLKVAGDERYQYEPLKNAWSHPCEAGQYLMLGAGEGDRILEANPAGQVADAKAYRAERELDVDSAEVTAFRKKRGLR